MQKNLSPVIKWSGSKRSQAEQITKFIDREYDTYYELFCGGCSVLFYILNNCPYFKHFVCNDINEPLINLYKLIMSNPLQVQSIYETHWKELNKDQDLDRKKEYFAKIRDEFNQTHRPDLFFFIMRTTTNGMPRYNNKGEFNNSFHVTRDGMNPKTTKPILENWSWLLNFYKVEFTSKSYEEFETSENDLLYLDPPYAGTKGMYYGGIDLDRLWEYLKNTKSDWFLSFDGIADTDQTVDIPKIYDEHHYLYSGNSSFRRVIGNKNDIVVKESLYVKKHP